MVIKKKIVKMPLRKSAAQLAQSRLSSAQPSKPLAMKPPAMKPSVKPSTVKPSAGKMMQKVHPKFALGKKQLNRRQDAVQRQAAPAKVAAPNSYTAEQVRDYFASVLSKDIRPKAGYLAKTLEKLRDGDITAMERGKMLDEMAGEVKDISQTIDDLLSISLLGSDVGGAVAAETDVASLARDIVESFRGEASAKGVSLSAKVEDLPILEVDAHRIRLVIRALVDNAVKFTSDGRIGVIVTYFGDRLRIVVEDTGCGIPPKVQEKFAESGFAAGENDGHAATGLAMVDSLVSSMNGDLKIRSALGVGTVVTVVFPRVHVAQGFRDLSSLQRIGTISIRPPAPPSSKILIVVESPVGSAALVGMLNKIGYKNVETAPNGAQGLTKLLNGVFDFVFTDVEMSEMDGRTLICEIRRMPTFSKLPVFALTSKDEVGEECANLDFTGVILAPLTTEKIQNALS